MQSLADLDLPNAQPSAAPMQEAGRRPTAHCSLLPVHTLFFTDCVHIVQTVLCTLCTLCKLCSVHIVHTVLCAAVVQQQELKPQRRRKNETQLIRETFFLWL